MYGLHFKTRNISDGSMADLIGTADNKLAIRLVEEWEKIIRVYEAESREEHLGAQPVCLRATSEAVGFTLPPVIIRIFFVHTYIHLYSLHVLGYFNCFQKLAISSFKTWMQPTANLLPLTVLIVRLDNLCIVS